MRMNSMEVLANVKPKRQWKECGKQVVNIMLLINAPTSNK